MDALYTGYRYFSAKTVFLQYLFSARLKRGLASHLKLQNIIARQCMTEGRIERRPSVFLTITGPEMAIPRCGIFSDFPTSFQFFPLVLTLILIIIIIINTTTTAN